MTIAVVDRPVTAGQYSAPSAITPVSLRPLDQANQRLENKYGDDVERISRSMRSGAGTTCGGCLPRLAELTAETLWQTVYCLEVIDRAPRVKSFRFEVPPYHGVGQPQPGQRLIVRATIGGVDVQRPYTLTSSVTERRYYELTVQREPHGIMSNWLFDNMGPGSAVAILPPSGTCFFELHEPRPLVCLVGGIGITPALGICRSATASGARRRVHVDYSVSTRSEMVVPRNWASS